MEYHKIPFGEENLFTARCSIRCLDREAEIFARICELKDSGEYSVKDLLFPTDRWMSKDAKAWAEENPTLSSYWIKQLFYEGRFMHPQHDDQWVDLKEKELKMLVAETSRFLKAGGESHVVGPPHPDTEVDLIDQTVGYMQDIWYAKNSMYSILKLNAQASEWVKGGQVDKVSPEIKAGMRTAHGIYEGLITHVCLTVIPYMTKQEGFKPAVHQLAAQSFVESVILFESTAHMHLNIEGEILEVVEFGGILQFPYPNEHSARLQDPKGFDPDTFRRTKGGTIYGKIKVPTTIAIIWGKKKGKAKPSDPPIPQALRFPVANWTAEKAKKWLKDNNVKYLSFEPAKKATQTSRPEDKMSIWQQIQEKFGEMSALLAKAAGKEADFSEPKEEVEDMELKEAQEKITQLEAEKKKLEDQIETDTKMKQEAVFASFEQKLEGLVEEGRLDRKEIPALKAQFQTYQEKGVTTIQFEAEKDKKEEKPIADVILAPYVERTSQFQTILDPEKVRFEAQKKIFELNTSDPEKLTEGLNDLHDEIVQFQQENEIEDYKTACVKFMAKCKIIGGE